MTKVFHVLSFALLIVMLAACAQAGPAPSKSQVKIGVTPASPTSAISSPLLGHYTATITHQDVAGHPELDDLGPNIDAGNMDIVAMWVLNYRSDGIWTAQNSNEQVRYIGTGTYKITQNRVTFMTDSKCLEYYVPYYGSDAQSATYTWQLSGKTLILQTASDLCLPRKIIMSSHPWTLQN